MKSWNHFFVVKTLAEKKTIYFFEKRRGLRINKERVDLGKKKKKKKEKGLGLGLAQVDDDGYYYCKMISSVLLSKSQTLRYNIIFLSWEMRK